jgi:hypothetical protein
MAKITDKGATTFCAMTWAWLIYELRKERGLMASIDEEATKQTIDLFKRTGMFCDASGRCRLKYKTIYNSLRNQRCGLEAHTLEQIKCRMRYLDGRKLHRPGFAIPIINDDHLTIRISLEVHNNNAFVFSSAYKCRS